MRFLPEIDTVPLNVEAGGRVIDIWEALKLVEPNVAMMFCPMLRPVAVEMTMFPPPALVSDWEMLSVVPGFQMMDPPCQVRLPVMDVVALRVRFPEARVTGPEPRDVALFEMREPAWMVVPPE